MENKNTGLKVLVIILSVLVVVLGGYIVYDKVLSNDNNKINNNNNTTNKDNKNNDSELNEEEYSINDFSGTVFQTFNLNNEGGYYLTLWDDGKYMYTNEHNIEETLGEYTIEDNKIKLTYAYIIERGNNTTSSDDDYVTLATEKKNKELTIYSLTELYDEENDIILTRVNQSPNQGGENYNTILENLID